MITQFSDGLYRGPTPKVADLQKYGITTVVNLQASPKEILYENTALRAVGIHEFAFPSCPVMPPSFRHCLRALAVLRTECIRPTYIHCRQGVDRTGFVVALYRMVEQGWSEERAWEEARSCGMHWWFWWWRPELRANAAELKRHIYRLR